MKWRISLAGLLLVLVGGGIWFLVRPAAPEPLFEGKPLSFWLRGYNFGPAAPERRKAEEVVRQLGTNAVPIALGMIREQTSAINQALMTLSRNQPYVAIKYRDVEERNFFGSMIFSTLGPDARDAVPALAAILQEHASTGSRLGAASASAPSGQPPRSPFRRCCPAWRRPTPCYAFIASSRLGIFTTNRNRLCQH